MDDTQQRPAVYRRTPSDEVPAPPRFLLWSVIGLFVLAVVGALAGVIIFRSVLEPAQQQRVMGVLPFMEAFLPPRPAAGDTLPTPESSTTDDISPDELLEGLALGGSGDAPVTPETEAPAVIAPPTATLEPTPEPTEASTEAPTTAPEPSATPEPEVAAPTTETPAPRVAVAQPTSTPTTGGTSGLSYPTAARLNGFRFEQQTWNNCGPANITMALSYFGWTRDQAFAASFLKPGGREDKNVSPWELVDFVLENTQIRALTRMGGNLNVLKALLANNFPVVIETGYAPEGYDWLGHYQTLVGYDESLGVVWLYDSFLGPGENGEGISESYSYMDDNWKHFNRRFIVLYEPAREATVRQILGDLAEPARAAEMALEVATNEVTANPRDGHAWFNMGTSLTALGEYSRAATAFDRARREGVPWRMLWYQFEPFEAYYGAGRYDELLSLVNSNLNNGANWVEETHYWQGRAYAAQGRAGEAATAFRNALRYNPRYQAAQAALQELDL